MPHLWQDCLIKVIFEGWIRKVALIHFSVFVEVESATMIIFLQELVFPLLGLVGDLRIKVGKDGKRIIISDIFVSVIA